MLNLLAFSYFSWGDCENSTCVGGKSFYDATLLFEERFHGNLFHMSKYLNCFYCRTNLNRLESNPSKIVYLGILEHLQTDQSFFVKQYGITLAIEFDKKYLWQNFFVIQVILYYPWLPAHAVIGMIELHFPGSKNRGLGPVKK